MISIDTIDQRERKKQQGQNAMFYSSCCPQPQSRGTQSREGQMLARGARR